MWPSNSNKNVDLTNGLSAGLRGCGGGGEEGVADGVRGGC